MLVATQNMFKTTALSGREIAAAGKLGDGVDEGEAATGGEVALAPSKRGIVTLLIMFFVRPQNENDPPPHLC